MRINTTNVQQTFELGNILGQEILASDIDEVLVIALEGDLGSGKTTFVKGLAKGLGIKETVVSPTFILIGAYSSELKTENFPPKAGQLGAEKLKTLYHIDPYRLEDVASLVPELSELLKVPNAVIAIEWAQRLKQYIPNQAIHIAFEHANHDERNITIFFPE